MSESKSDKQLSSRIPDLENYYAENVLSDDLKKIYGEIQVNCGDFREKIFFKNLDVLENKMAIFDKNFTFHTYNMKDFEALIKKIELPSELHEKFEKIAQDE